MTLQGIDISGWQKGINLAAVPADFVIMKATGGKSVVVGDCDRQYQQAKAAGKLRGVYHFAKDGGPANSATVEADHFVQATKGYQDGETLLVLDFEADAVSLGAGWAHEWLARVLAQTGIRPLIYMSGSLAGQTQWDPVVKDSFGLWVANWGSNPVTGHVAAPAVSSGRWPFEIMRQYSSNGTLPGYGGRLDMDVFYGDHSVWMKYAAKNGQVVTTPPSTPTTPEPPAPPANDIDTIARQVIAGQWGNGNDRKARLTAAGYDYAAVQAHVNILLGVHAPAPMHQTYTVQRGDTLSGIASRLHIAGGWNALYQANKGIIGSNPSLIKPGQKLILP